MPPSESSRAKRFRGLMAPHLDSAYGLARYLCRDATSAEDIAQDALLKAFAGFDGFRGGSPRAWLLAIVRNAYIDWGRRSRAWRGPGEQHLGMDEAAEIADPDMPTPEAALIARGDAVALRGAIEALAEPYRETLVLRDIEGLNYQQIAEITGAPVGTVMSRLSRARRALIDRLAPNEGMRE